MKFMVSGNKVSFVCAGSLVTETIRLKSGFLGHIAASSKLIRSGSLSYVGVVPTGFRGSYYDLLCLLIRFFW